jgi:hypothetical protein
MSPVRRLARALAQGDCWVAALCGVCLGCVAFAPLVTVMYVAHSVTPSLRRAPSSFTLPRTMYSPPLISSAHPAVSFGTLGARDGRFIGARLSPRTPRPCTVDVTHTDPRIPLACMTCGANAMVNYDRLRCMLLSH